DGVRELIIVAQDTTYYGMDLYGRPQLTELLQQLDQIDQLDWIRLMYFYPMYIDDRLIQTLAQATRIVPYLDMPLQHINDTMLRRMSRRVTRQETEELLAKLRGNIPDLVMRTTFITGFPGETDEQYQELVEFVRAQRFERMGVFTYSLEPDTPAASLPDLVPDAVSVARRDGLMQAQQEIAFAWNQQQLGRQIPVILDGEIPEQPNAWVG
ncbi:MAG: radical SAM protein, partial [Planctomycetales bacterium]|nr:radical SAM protein [Planctomycetales bacterium]